MDVARIRKIVHGDPVALFEHLDQMQGTIDETIQVARHLASDLRPGVLDDLGVSAAIDWEAQMFQEGTGISVSIDDQSGGLILDRDRATDLFRIFKETLALIAHHEGASEVAVFLDKSEDSIELNVRDNGTRGAGCRQDEVMAVGILDMRERLLEWGGNIDIEGIPGCGATVKVLLPIHHMRTVE
jgi:signal transduction histidine kinase